MTRQSAEEDGTVDPAAYLRARCSEPVPEWLRNFPTANYHDYRPTPAEDFDLRPFFQSRVVYYPGSGTDGHAVKLFGSAHTAHCFFYLSYSTTGTVYRTRMDPETPKLGFLGYRPVAALDLSPPREIHRLAYRRRAWRDYDQEPEEQRVVLANIEFDLGIKCNFQRPRSFLYLYILKRNQDYGDDHGVERFAWLVGNFDGIANYRCFASQASMDPRNPYAMLLQEHGFGGNYDSFGRGHLMEKIADEIGRHPKWVLSPPNDRIMWHRYQVVPNIKIEYGGGMGHARTLYRRIPDSETTPAVP